jgi:hypothetical protein
MLSVLSWKNWGMRKPQTRLFRNFPRAWRAYSSTQSPLPSGYPGNGLYMRYEEHLFSILLTNAAQLLSPSIQVHGHTKAESDPTRINTDDKEAVGERQGLVSFLIAPGLMKRGTERGAKLNTEERVLVKAYVKLDPLLEEEVD